MLVNFLIGFFGIILFLFVLWKRIKEDFSSEIIFQVGFTMLAGAAIGVAASKLFFPAWFFWSSLGGVIAGTFLMMAKFKMKFYETIEDLVLAGMPVIALIFFENSIIHSSLNSFLAFVACLILVFLSYWFDVSYKNFVWYKSGRIGFAGLMVGIIFFLGRTVVASLGIPVISFVGRSEPFLSGFFTLVFVGLLVKLSISKK